MENNYQFDRNFMLKSINDIQRLLNDTNKSLRIKRNLKAMMKVLRNLIEKNYNYYDEVSIKAPSDLEKIKRIVLNRMRIAYKTLGPDLICWLLDLIVLGIFDLDYELEEQKTILNIDTQADLTIENYNMKSRRYFEIAKEIILNRKGAQIELIDDIKIESYCVYNDFVKQSFIVLNPTDAPWILNHEIQHAVENICEYQTHNMYDELGAHYFEMLFLDTLYDNQGYLLTGDYIEKMKDAKDLLEYLYGYLNCIMVFCTYNFEVPLDIFINGIMDCYDVDLKTAYDDILINELFANNSIKDMNYLFSYLKAIELRERTFLTKKSSDDILEPYINSRRFKFYPPKDIGIYKRYITEMQQKTRILQK